MKVHLIAIGRAKRGPEKDLFDHYVSRIRWPFSLHELEEKKALSGEALKSREAELLLNAVPSGAAVVALDERGKAMGSIDLSTRVQSWEDEGRPATCFIIGGADGLHETVRQRADLCLSFGKLTWPHMLVRPMLAEQIYRCQQIKAGHPYHRE